MRSNIYKFLQAGVLLFMLLTLIHAESYKKIPPIGVADLQISLGVDAVKSKPIDSVKSITPDQKLLYASGWMRYAPKDTEITFRWYRYLDATQKSIILESKTAMSGSRFIYASLEFDKGSVVLEGKYGVAVMAGGEILADTSFAIRSPIKEDTDVEVERSCKTFDEKSVLKIVSKLKQEYPDMQKEADIKLGLYSDPKNGIVFYVPNGWLAAGDANKSILDMRQEESPEANRYRVRKIEKFWDAKDMKNPEDFLYQVAKSIGDISIEAAKRGGDEANYMGEVSLFASNGYTIAHHVIHRTGRVNKYKSTTLLYDGRDLYMLGVTSRESDLGLGEFFSSLWYLTFCDSTSIPSKPKVVPPNLDSCLHPGTKDDEALLEGLLSSNPQMKSVAVSEKIKFKRYYDKKRGFSILAPSDWEAVALSKTAILHLRYLDPSNIYLEMQVSKIPIGQKLLDSSTPKQILEKFAKHMSTPQNSESLTVVKRLKVIELSNKTLGSLRIKEMVKGIEVYQSMTLLFENDILYMIVTIVDQPNFDLGRLLSAVGMYTFVTKDMCKTRRH